MNLAKILRSDYARFPQDQTYSIYAEDVYFKDPLSEFRGLDRYRQNIRFIERWFLEPQLELHDLSQQDNRIETRWTLRWTVPLPWRPKVAIAGWSELLLNESGLIASHIDYWNEPPRAVLKQLLPNRRRTNR
jgi:hypothetical protein